MKDKNSKKARWIVNKIYTALQSILEYYEHLTEGLEEAVAVDHINKFMIKGRYSKGENPVYQYATQWPDLMRRVLIMKEESNTFTKYYNSSSLREILYAPIQRVRDLLQELENLEFCSTDALDDLCSMIDDVRDPTPGRDIEFCKIQEKIGLDNFYLASQRFLTAHHRVYELELKCDMYVFTDMGALIFPFQSGNYNITLRKAESIVAEGDRITTLI